MKNSLPAKTKTTLDPLFVGNKLAWQRWNSTGTGWESKVQQLCELNFVFQTIWEPRCKEVWIERRGELMEATLLAKRAWEAWQRTLDFNAELDDRNGTTIDHLPSGDVAVEVEDWMALLHATQPTWDHVLRELESAVPDDMLFLPADTRRLMANVQQTYHTIIQTTEKAMRTWSSEVSQNPDALDKVSERLAKVNLPGAPTLRTHDKLPTSSVKVVQ